MAAVALGLIVSLAVAVIVADPTDPRDEIRRELARGRKVTLIGESGGPRWHEWQLAPGKFEALQDGDTVCSFLSRDVSLLVLLDDPGIDRYVVRAEVRQNLKAGEQDPRANKSTDSVGLAIGHTTLRAGGFRIDSLMLLGFSDHDRPGPPEADKRLTLRHVALAGQPLAPKGVFQERGPNTPLSPPYDAVRPWRPIGFEVTPDGVAPLAGTAFASHPRATIERRMADLGTQLRTSPARFAGTLPVWSPRSPVGIWCNGSWVSVRNVTIEPLPIPR